MSASNHRRLDCLLNCWFRRRSKKASRLCVTSLCQGIPPVTGGFPSQRTSYADNVSIWWRHHACPSVNDDLIYRVIDMVTKQTSKHCRCPLWILHSEEYLHVRGKASQWISPTCHSIAIASIYTIRTYNDPRPFPLQPMDAISIPHVKCNTILIIKRTIQMPTVHMYKWGMSA